MDQLKIDILLDIVNFTEGLESEGTSGGHLVQPTC